MYLYNVLEAALQWIQAQLGPFIFIIRCFFILLQFPFVLMCKRRSLSGKAPLAYMPCVLVGHHELFCLTVWLFGRKTLQFYVSFN